MKEKKVRSKFSKQSRNDDIPFSNDAKSIATLANCLDKVLSYFHVKHSKLIVPSTSNSMEEAANYILKPYGVSHRKVKLDENWYKLAFGTMVGYFKDSHDPVVLIPNKLHGYSYFDFKLNKKIRINKNNVHLFGGHALFFYNPLPLRPLSIKDLIVYSLRQISKRDIAIFILLLAVVTVLGMFGPAITWLLFGFVPASQDYMLLLSTSIYLICFTVGGLLFHLYKGLFESNMSTKISIFLEAAVMHRVLSLPASFFTNYNSSELNTRVSQIKSIVNNLIYSIGLTAISAILSLTYIFQIFAYSPALVAPAFILIALNSAYSIFVAIANGKYIAKHIKVTTKETATTFSIIEGMEKIHTTNSEELLYKKWEKDYLLEARFNFKPPIYIRYAGLISTLISLGGTMLFYFVALKTDVRVDSYFAFMSAYGLASSAFSKITDIVRAVSTFKPSYELAKPILVAQPEVGQNKIILDHIDGNIEFENVSFRYNEDSPMVLKKLSFKIKKGEYVAIVGKTGCGKSTLVKLMLGFIKPDKGTIKFDNKDMDTLDLPALRTNIGTVMQSCKLLSGTIYDNITIASPSPTLEQAWDAAKIAQIDKDIKELPMGMHTLISEGSGGISGGQRQRLAIARSVVNKPNLLIFDEATSALDNVTQKNVCEAIDSLKCTRLVIAHRLSTIKNCNRILLIEDGSIVEDGSYDELIKKKGKFANLVARQRIDDI